MTVIAIDGPAGAGKSTVAREVAARLGLARLDTGAMYRAVTLLVLHSGAEPGDEEAAASLAREMDLEVGEDRVVLNGEDVTAAIRARAVDAAVSVVAAGAKVRAELVRRQRAWAAERGGGVVEGRDIGSVVFPDADVKVYLTADPFERARRRNAQVLRGGGTDVPATPGRGEPAEGSSLSATEAQLMARDRLDSSRVASPLAVPSGAILVDSTGRSIGEVVDEVMRQL